MLHATRYRLEPAQVAHLIELYGTHYRDVLNLLDSDDHDITYWYESQLRGAARFRQVVVGLLVAAELIGGCATAPTPSVVVAQTSRPDWSCVITVENK